MKLSSYLTCCCFFALSVSAVPPSATALVPLPKKIEPRGGTFILDSKTRIIAVGAKTGAAMEVASYLADRLRVASGAALRVSRSSQGTAPKGGILLTSQGAVPMLSGEGYELDVTPEAIVIRARYSAGLFYGVQSLLQLMPPQALASQPQPVTAWRIPAVLIQDEPRFAWRGFLLDVARHFFSKEEIKKILDVMAQQKLNRLQLHLTDDQGWRVEIKKYPLLTEVGAWRKSIGFGLDPKASTAYGPDGRYGGYYSQADIRELVSYAAARHINIVPEIEMPGHAGAALASYPELSCSGRPYSTDGSELPAVFCAGQDQTFEFLQNVLTEICELFPGKYVHIGGDEVPPDNWKNCPRCEQRKKQEGLHTEPELESYFIRRIEAFLNARGRRLIGWSEIREGGLAQNATIMDWIGGAVEGARTGHDVIMTPTSYCYLDYYQSTNSQPPEPKAIGGYVPLEQVYAFEPVPATLEPQFRAYIIGAQANLWTEFIPSLQHAEYMAFPRLCALAEVTWSPPASRNYADFLRRLRVQAERLDVMGVNFRRASLQEPARAK